MRGHLRGRPGCRCAHPGYGCYGIPASRISDHVAFDPALAIKFTLYRLRPSGSVGDPDMFGSQQYAPLLDVQVPLAAAVN